MGHIYDFTAAYTVNETGFGVMTLNDPAKLTYMHLSTKRGYVDSMVLEKVSLRKQVKQRERGIWSRVEADEL